ncbi:MAG TPA: hypothetical protein VMU85_15790 [Stellaceae bacterium]|nr:hypothetical protein [Stellaceae bacterium]
MTIGSRLAGTPQALLDRLLIASILAAGAAYIVLARSFFPDAGGKLGDDYEYFLPLLLAGKYWIAENGLLAAPRFSPAFCAGLPLLANPQSIFYSLPQALALGMSPVASMLGTTIIAAAAGAAGTFALLRRRFAASLPAASLCAVIFLFNGFLLHRMAIGHVTYHVIALLPALCCFLLAPLPAAPLTRRLLHGIGPAALTAAILAYVIYAGAPNILVPLAIAAVAVWLIHALARQPVASFWTIGAAGGLLAAATGAAKLAPAIAFIQHFPRPHEIHLIDNAGFLVNAAFTGFFLPMLLPDHLWIVGMHEFEFGLGLAPLVLLLIALRRYGLRALRHIGGPARKLQLAALVLALAVPFAVNYGGPGYAAWLKSLPYIGENVILVRWLLIYLLPLTVGTGLALDKLASLPAQRSALALAGVLVTVLPPLVTERPYYEQQPYDPAPVQTADAALRQTGHVPAITGLVAPASFRRDDGITAGQSSIRCYEPLFGYHLEAFPTRLQAGPILTGEPDERHLRNPACYLYGRENGCRPGDAFDDAARQEEASFAAYRPFAYVLPAWQRWADLASLLGLATILIGGAVAAGRWWHARAARHPASGPLRESTL